MDKKFKFEWLKITEVKEAKGNIVILYTAGYAGQETNRSWYALQSIFPTYFTRTGVKFILLLPSSVDYIRTFNINHSGPWPLYALHFWLMSLHMSDKRFEINVFWFPAWKLSSFIGGWERGDVILIGHQTSCNYHNFYLFSS